MTKINRIKEREKNENHRENVKEKELISLIKRKKRKCYSDYSIKMRPNFLTNKHMNNL